MRSIYSLLPRTPVYVCVRSAIPPRKQCNNRQMQAHIPMVFALCPSATALVAMITYKVSMNDSEFMDKLPRQYK